MVARSSCAESLPQSVRRFIRVADSPNEFAKHLIELSNVDAWNMALGDIQSAQAALTNDQQPVNVIMGKWLDRWGVDAVSSDRLPVVPGFDRVSVQRIEQQVEQVLVQASAPEQASWVDLVERLAAAEARSDAIERSEVWRATAPIRRVGNALRSNAPWLNARLRSGRLADCLRRKLGSPRR